jgi:hypothetical protein
MYLFIVPGADEMYPRIQYLTDEINAAISAPTFEQLASVGSITMIAGGVGKRRVVRHLLDRIY